MNSIPPLTFVFCFICQRLGMHSYSLWETTIDHQSSIGLSSSLISRVWPTFDRRKAKVVQPWDQCCLNFITGSPAKKIIPYGRAKEWKETWIGDHQQVHHSYLDFPFAGPVVWSLLWSPHRSTDLALWRHKTVRNSRLSSSLESSGASKMKAPERSNMEKRPFQISYQESTIACLQSFIPFPAVVSKRWVRFLGMMDVLLLGLPHVPNKDWREEKEWRCRGLTFHHFL